VFGLVRTLLVRGASHGLEVSQCEASVAGLHFRTHADLRAIECARGRATPWPDACAEALAALDALPGERREE
jgi:hypothetical protein